MPEAKICTPKRQAQALRNEEPLKVGKSLLHLWQPPLPQIQYSEGVP